MLTHVIVFTIGLLIGWVSDWLFGTRRSAWIWTTLSAIGFVLGGSWIALVVALAWGHHLARTPA